MKHLLWLALLGLTAQRAQAIDEIGVVQALNAQPTSKLVLMSDEQKSSQTICEGVLSPRLFKLVGMQVKLTGDWQEAVSKKAADRCFAPKAFTVLKTSSGRQAITGKLVAKSQGLVIEKDDGSLVSLPIETSASEPYKKMIGSKVIADVRQFKSGPKLVTLILHP